MDRPPPPPPPHGANQQSGRAGGLPDGKYDIFIVPPHSAGSGFLYLPSLATHRNSFLAGAICTAFAFFVYSVAVPVVKEFFQGIMAGNSSGVMVLTIGVGVLCWAWGKTQAEGVRRPDPGPAGSTGGSSTAGGAFGGHAGGPPPTGAPPTGAPPTGAPPTGAPPTGAPPPNPSAQQNASAPPPPGGAAPRSSWQRPNPQASSGTGANSSAKTSWEKAREEMRKKEEERRRTEEAKKRREEAEKERQKQREKEAREKEARERRERREREQKEKEEKEREERERKEKEAAEKEKERQKAASEPARERSPPKKPPQPTVRTEHEDDAYSFRPYDRPKKPVHKANSAASMYSESSYAPSQSTARTTPPPVPRPPYTTKDPDKIIIKGVYSFNNAFMRTPIAQLISGSGNVTDGLILRITTEGLFIDDDVRGVPQREWDIKAWTMKLAEVWCPNSLPGLAVPRSPRRKISQSGGPVQTRSESDAFLTRLSEACATCRYPIARSEAASSCSTRQSFSVTSASGSAAHSHASAGTDETVRQSGEMMGLHVLRASIRDQEGKKYVFVLSQSEGWKVAMGLQRLRRGTQVRALAVSGLPPNETKALIENLGWA